MGIFLQSIEGVLVILVMIVLGYCLARAGWFDEKSSKLIARLVTQVALPCYMLDTITRDFTAKELFRLLPDLKFPVVSMLILFGISVAVARIIRIRKERRGLFESMFLIRIRCSLAYQSTWRCLVPKVYRTCWCIIWPIRRFSGR